MTLLSKGASGPSRFSFNLSDICIYVQHVYEYILCVTCTWRSVCDTWRHAVPLYAVMGQWNQVMVA